MRTYITDNFPLRKLECQYFDICKYYDPKRCAYGEKCSFGLQFPDGRYILIRDVLKGLTEQFIEKKNLEFQIELILDDYKENP